MDADDDILNLRAKADELKLEANTEFGAKNIRRAIDLYGDSLRYFPIAAVYSNRAFCHLKLESWGCAIADATEAIKLDSSFAKAYYRRGCAYLGLGKFKDAKKDLKFVVKLCPTDADANKKLKECDSQIRRMAFEEAIAMDHDHKTAFEEIDILGMSVPSDYDGPSLYVEESQDKSEDNSSAPMIDMIDIKTSRSAPKFEVTPAFCVALMEHLRAQKTLPKKYALLLMWRIRELLHSLPTLIDVSILQDGTLTVCGDTHGQFYDFLNIFSLNGIPSPTNGYLFNGDFVDRGSFGVEIALCLFAWKLCYPENFHLARGNHETKRMNAVYGFEGEVRHKYGDSVMSCFTEIFHALPLCHVIEKQVMVVHGGLFSKDGVKLDDIRKINRFCEPPDEGLMSEILWSDPQPMLGRGPSKRGVGLAFGPDVTSRFLEDNNLKLVVRSHEVKDDGYEIEANGKLITVFSAPNYCDQIGNKGAFLKFTSGSDLSKPSCNTFTSVPHPPVRPMQYASSSYSNMFQYAS